MVHVDDYYVPVLPSSIIPSPGHKTALNRPSESGPSARHCPLLLPSVSGPLSMYQWHLNPAVWSRVPVHDRIRRHYFEMHSDSAPHFLRFRFQKNMPISNIPTVLHFFSPNLLFYETSPDPSLHPFNTFILIIQDLKINILNFYNNQNI